MKELVARDESPGLDGIAIQHHEMIDALNMADPFYSPDINAACSLKIVGATETSRLLAIN